jgi:hypothetical protein
MEPIVTVEHAEPTAEDGRVYHVDQLSERERDCLYVLSQEDSSVDVDWRAAAALAEYDVIKSSAYVRVTYHESNGMSGSVGANP